MCADGILRLNSSRVDNDQRHIEQNASKHIDKQEERILAEAKQDKLRYLEEVHSAQRKVNDLQAHLKMLESKLADKDAEIRLLQEKKCKYFIFLNAIYGFLIGFYFFWFSQYVDHHLIRIIATH